MRRSVVIILTLMALGMWLHSVGTIPNLRTPWGIWYLGVDPWYHMRLADYMLANGGSYLAFDAYAAYPNGVEVGYRPMLGWLIYWGSWLVTWGHPTQAILEKVGAWMPVIIGALCVIPVYVTAQRLTRSYVVAALAAFFLTILPGEFFQRSMFGFTDHHVLEVFWTTLVVMCLVKARDNPLLWGAGAGLAQLGLFYSWHGAPFLVAIVCVWGIGYVTIEHLRRRDGPRAISSQSYAFAVYGLVVIVVWVFVPSVLNASTMDTLAVIALVGSAAWMIALDTIMPRGRPGKVIVASVGVLAIAGAVVAINVSPQAAGMAQEIARQLRSTFWGVGSTINEAQPTLFLTAWRYYGALCIIAPFGFFFAIRDRLDWLFVVWTVFMLVAALGQRRWNYIAIVPVVICGAYALKLAADYLIARARPSYYLVVLAVVIGVSIPGIQDSYSMRASMTLPMWNAMQWLKTNTPEPFGDPEAYTRPLSGDLAISASQDIEISGTWRDVPRYGVLCWWDYGHWVIRVARRVPLSSPTWQETAAQKFLLAQSVEEAEAYIEGLNIGFVMITEDDVVGKFPHIAERMGFIDDISDWATVRDKAMMVRLWDGEAIDGYTLVFAEGTVKLFQRDLDLGLAPLSPSTLHPYDREGRGPLLSRTIVSRIP